MGQALSPANSCPHCGAGTRACRLGTLAEAWRAPHNSAMRQPHRFSFPSLRRLHTLQHRHPPCRTHALQEPPAALRDLRNRQVKRFLIGLRRLLKPADLPNKLPRRRLYLIRCSRRPRRPQYLNAPAHSSSLLVPQKAKPRCGRHLSEYPIRQTTLMRAIAFLPRRPAESSFRSLLQSLEARLKSAAAPPGTSASTCRSSTCRRSASATAFAAGSSASAC